MARINPQIEQLQREVDTLRKRNPGDYPVHGCGDNSCVVEAPHGMSTNGGCNCEDRVLRWARQYYKRLACFRAEIIKEMKTTMPEDVKKETRELCKIKLHSITDLITNSSTTIYTYSENSVDACKQMINDILKTFGIDKTCDDLFVLTVMLDEYRYKYWLDWYQDENKLSEKQLIQLISKIKKGKAEKPEWMLRAESAGDRNFDTTLYIHPKEKKYAKIASSIEQFLYSTEHQDYHS